jgi:hypothetical protein
MAFSNERDLGVDNPMMAQPLLDFLLSNGVEAHLRDDDDMGGLNPALAFVHGTYITVPMEQLDLAQQLVDAFQTAPLEDVPELGGQDFEDL